MYKERFKDTHIASSLYLVLLKHTLGALEYTMLCYWHVMTTERKRSISLHTIR